MTSRQMTLYLAIILFFFQLAFIEEQTQKVEERLKESTRRFDQIEKKIDALDHQLKNLYGKPTTTDIQDQ